MGAFQLAKEGNMKTKKREENRKHFQNASMFMLPRGK